MDEETEVLRALVKTLVTMGDCLTDLLAGAIVAIECNSTISQDDFDATRRSIVNWRDISDMLRTSGLST